MYEWVHRKKFKLYHFNEMYPQASSLAEVFELARKIANGTKHFNPKVKTRIRKGFSSEFSDEFARPLMVKVSNVSEISADRLLCDLVDFWKEQAKKGAF